MKIQKYNICGSINNKNYRKMVIKLKERIKIVKTFILIAVVGLLLSVTSTKIASANMKNTVGIIVVTDEGEKCLQIEMNDTQIGVLKKDIYNFEDWLKENNPLSDLKLDDNEKMEIKGHVNNLTASLPEDVQILVNSDEIIKLITPEKKLYLWLSLLIRQPVISIGDSGKSFIPFSQYEWAVSFGAALHMGIWTGYAYNEVQGLKGGFTSFIRIYPEIKSEEYSGSHIVGIRGLKGIYINIGALGYKESYGPVVLIGRAYPILALQN